MIGSEETAFCSAEGECNSSQAKGPGHDDTLKSGSHGLTPKEQPLIDEGISQVNLWRHKLCGKRVYGSFIFKEEQYV